MGVRAIRGKARNKKWRGGGRGREGGEGGGREGRRLELAADLVGESGSALLLDHIRLGLVRLG